MEYHSKALPLAVVGVVLKVDVHFSACKRNHVQQAPTILYSDALLTRFLLSTQYAVCGEVEGIPKRFFIATVCTDVYG